MTAPTAGRSLELYYIGGRPDGMLTAEMFNWTGHVLKTPRTQLAMALTRSEATYAGVYLLLDDQDGASRLYVGEGEDISERIRTHDVKKDWWDIAVLVTTAGNKLNKAHIRYLEARLIEDAKRVGRASLDNVTLPSRPVLSEADTAKMEAFLENLLIVLPAVRVDIFTQRARTPQTLAGANPAPSSVFGPTFQFEVKKYGLRATARLENGEFVVAAGSMARKRRDGVNARYTALHDQLMRASILVEQGENCVFATDYAFTSPSAAAAVIAGRSTNGATSWLTDTGQTYKEWEAARLARVDVP